MTTTTTMQDWKIGGVNMINTDSGYQIVQAVMRDETLSDEEKIKQIQKKTGHLGPVEINKDKHIVYFYRF